MHNPKCAGLTELPNGVKQLFYYWVLLPHCWIHLEPWDFRNFQTAVFSNKNITYKKHFKRKTGSQMGIFLFKLTVLGVKTSFQELPWELARPVRRRRWDMEFMCLSDGFKGVLHVRAWGKRWWYLSSRKYFTVTNFPSNQEPCRALKAFPACPGDRHLTYTQPCNTSREQRQAEWS